MVVGPSILLVYAWVEVTGPTQGDLELKWFKGTTEIDNTRLKASGSPWHGVAKKSLRDEAGVPAGPDGAIDPRLAGLWVEEPEGLGRQHRGVPRLAVGGHTEVREAGQGEGGRGSSVSNFM